MGTIQLGLCQMKVTADKAENLRTAEEAIRTAARQGAELVLLPEMFNCPYENACFPVYAEPAGGETWQFLSRIAKELGIYLAGGSVPEREGNAIYNTCYLFSPQGEELARHRKVPSLRHRRAGRSALHGVRHFDRRGPDHRGRHTAGQAGHRHLL